MWLLYRKHTEGCNIRHDINGCDYRPPEIPNMSVGGFCAETRTVYEFY